MTQSRTGFVSRRGAPPPQTEGEVRRSWLTLLAVLRDHVDRALSDRPIDRIEAANLAHLVVRQKAQFPIRQASLLNIADASLTLARGFVAAARPEDRRAAARILAPAIDHLDSALVAQGHALAEQSRRWAGDTD